MMRKSVKKGPGKKGNRLASGRSLTLMVIILVVFTFGALLLFHQDIAARGNQFKGILPPKSAAPVKEKVKPELEEPLEPEYPQLNMIINLPARKVTLYDEGREVIRSNIAIGQPRYKTPLGPMEIKTIIWNPWWIPPNSPWARGSKRTPPGPGNPLGTVKMLMQRGIRLHGNNRKSSIGRAASHGCLRMHNDEASNLAWYIQKRFNETDDKFFNKYKKHRRSSFYVNLLSSVVVDIIYKPVEVRDDIIYIYKDIYGYAGNIKAEVIDALLQAGINLNKIDAKEIAKLKFPTGKGYVKEIPIRDLLTSRAKKNSCVATLE
jgi:hypothetical protein